jgi:nitric oxide dioxygenase
MALSRSAAILVTCVTPTAAFPSPLPSKHAVLHGDACAESPAVLGMFNFRGRVVLVADFRACLGWPSKPITNDTRIVLVSHHDETVGLVVDAVTEVITVEIDALHSVSGMPLGSGCVLNTTQLGDRLMLEVDYERALDEGLSGVTGHDALPLAELLRTAEPEPVVAAEEEAVLNVELLESSFALLAPRGEELVERFYENLFDTAPSVRAIFPVDLAGQRRALLGALGMVVSNLRSPEKLTEFLDGLGKRHIAYGAADAHYDVVGAVLLRTMAELAGDLWNDELQSAWAAAYGAVRDIMLAAASQELAAAAA